MKRSLIIRPAEPMDAEALARLTGQLGYPVTVEEVVERLRQAQSLPEWQAVLVAVLPDGRVVGWIQVHRVVFLGGAPFTEIGGLVVDETCRRMGIGRALVRAAEEWTLQHGMVDVSVRSNIIRDGAHAFYRQLGYRLVKTQYTFHKELIG